MDINDVAFWGGLAVLLIGCGFVPVSMLLEERRERKRARERQNQLERQKQLERERYVHRPMPAYTKHKRSGGGSSSTNSGSSGSTWESSTPDLGLLNDFGSSSSGWGDSPSVDSGSSSSSSFDFGGGDFGGGGSGGSWD